MFGLGKKKISAYKYALKTVSLSFAMATTFVDAWNSKRHKHDIEPLDKRNRELFIFFAFYNLLMSNSKPIVKLQDPLELQTFSGLTLLMYFRESEDLDLLPSDITDMETPAQFRDTLQNIQAEYGIYIRNSENRRERPMGEMIHFLVSEMLIKDDQSGLLDFINELIDIMDPIHDESWSQVINSKEIPVLDDETMDYYMRLK